MISSPCKVEFIPEGGTAITLVDFGGDLEQLPRFSAQQGMFEVPGIDATEGFFRPLGGAVVTIALRISQDVADFLEAENIFLAADAIGPVQLTSVDGALVITGTRKVATYAHAILGAARPTLPADPVALRVTRDFNIRASLPVISDVE